MKALTERSQSLFAVVGGWRTVAEVFATRVLFLVSYLLTPCWPAARERASTSTSRTSSATWARPRCC
jgi:hypothetical protein